jgi:hypothetical protein
MSSPDGRLCKNCGKPIERRLLRTAVYCSAKCREAYHVKAAKRASVAQRGKLKSRPAGEALGLLLDGPTCGSGGCQCRKLKPSVRRNAGDNKGKCRPIRAGLPVRQDVTPCWQREIRDQYRIAHVTGGRFSP